MRTRAVREFWEREACGERYGSEQDRLRYEFEPEILRFADFDSAAGKRVLEIGVGMGSDFLRWVRAGAVATGVDLTDRAVALTRDRLRQEGLQADVRVADAEALPFDDGQFDIVYSWGVLHHAPNPALALSEAQRVLAPGGQLKVMLYHRRSWVALAAWGRFCALRGKPLKTLRDAVANVESPGTQAFTPDEVCRMLRELENVQVVPTLTRWDARVAPLLARAVGGHFGWFLLVSATKAGGDLAVKQFDGYDPSRMPDRRDRRAPAQAFGYRPPVPAIEAEATKPSENRDSTRASIRRFLTNRYMRQPFGLARGAVLPASGGIRSALGIYELEIARYFVRLVARDAICYDIGAANGFYTFALAKRAREGRVYGFECDSEMYGALQEGLRRNPELASRVTPVPLAVGATDDDTTITVDAFVGRQGRGAAPGFLKIDVEGMEHDVLLGARRTIYETRPRFIIETHGFEVEAACLSFLADAGYAYSIVNAQRIWRELRPTEVNRWVIAVHRDDRAVNVIPH